MATAEYVLDETNEALDLPPGCTWLTLENRRGIPIQPAEVINRLRGARHVGSIRKLGIGWTSQLADLAVLEALPDVEVVLVRGGHIATLDGIEAVRRGQFLDINTGTNKKRRLGALRAARFDAVQLLFAHRTDLEALGSCRAARSLVVAKAPAIDFASWSELRIEMLQLNACSLKAVQNTARIASLRKLSVVHCRSIEVFAGDCSNIRWALIDAPKALDIGSLAALSGVRSAHRDAGRAGSPFHLLRP
jgi:hypothetical protein